MSRNPFLAAVERDVLAPIWCGDAPAVLALPETDWQRTLSDAVAPF